MGKIQNKISIKMDKILNSQKDIDDYYMVQFLMATSAIGPAFLTQTAVFTAQFYASFAFAILISIIIDIGAQINIWRILVVTGLRGQEISNKVLPGLGTIISILIAFGGLAFNIGNIAGAGLGLNAIFGLDVKWGLQ